MWTKFIRVLLLVSLGPIYSYSQTSIIPAPRHITYFEGFFDLNRAIDVEILNSSSSPIPAISQLKSMLEQDQSLMKSAKASHAPGKIVLGIPLEEDYIKLRSLNRLNPDTLGTEGYHLSISDDTIFIFANANAGVLYGVQTLKQLWNSNAEDGRIPNMLITDFPLFAFRGVLDDISRGPIPNLNFIKQQIQRLSELKINVFTFYIEHVVKTKSHPGFAPEHGISIEEFKELQAYAKDFNVQLMGGFQSLGHFRNILKVPAYSNLGISDRMLDPINPEAATFLKEVYSEMIPAFDHPIFNINCDETYDLARNHLKPIADKKGEGQVFADHVIPLLKYISQSGKRPGMWGDMLLKHPEIIPQLPDETVIFTWNYDDRPSFQDYILPFEENNLKYIVCPGVVNSNRLWPDYEVSLNNIRQFVWDGYQHEAEGVLTTVWDEGGSHFFSRDWYGIAYAADCSWSPGKSKSSNFEQRFSSIFYQDSNNLFPKFVQTISKISRVDRTANLDNTLFNIELFSDESRLIRMDTQGFQELKKILFQAQVIMQRLRSKKPVNPGIAKNYYWSDLQIWELTVETLLETIVTMEKLIYTTHSLNKLLEKTPMSVSHSIENIRDEMIELRKFWENLTYKFAYFWRYENNPHWHQEAFTFFYDKIKAIEKQIYYLTNLTEQIPVVNDDLNLSNPNPYIASDGFMVKYWLGFGPLQRSEKRTFQYDYLAKEGGEKFVKPSAVAYYEDTYGNFIGLKKLISKQPDQVDLSDFYDWSSESLAYASFRLESQREKWIFIDLETEAQVKLFLNGKELDYKSTSPDTHHISIKCKLSKGWNYFLLKLATNNEDRPSFLFKIKGESIRQNKYRYYID